MSLRHSIRAQQKMTRVLLCQVPRFNRLAGYLSACAHDGGLPTA